MMPPWGVIRGIWLHEYVYAGGRYSNHAVGTANRVQRAYLLGMLQPPYLW